MPSSLSLPRCSTALLTRGCCEDDSPSRTLHLPAAISLNELHTCMGAVGARVNSECWPVCRRQRSSILGDVWPAMES